MTDSAAESTVDLDSAAITGVGQQFTLDLAAHTPQRNADIFIPHPSNAHANSLLDRWPHWPGGRMALAGPAGVGKSHLARLWAVRARAALITLTDLESLPLPCLLDRAEALLLDPVAAKIPETPLLHLLNYAAERAQTVLLVARQPPARWPVALPDLRSRLAAMPVAMIEQPDDCLLQSLIMKLLAARQLNAPPELSAYLVRRIERSSAAAGEIVARLDQASLAVQRPIGLSLARELLEQELLEQDQPEEVAHEFRS